MTEREATTEELISELALLRRRTTELEHIEQAYRRVQDALRESEQKCGELREKWRRTEEVYQSVLNSSADAIVLYDMEGRAQYVSPSFTRIFGWTMDDVRDRQIPFVPQSERMPTQVKIDGLVKEGRPCSDFETSRTTKDGRRLDVSLSASRYQDHEGNSAGILVILRDITDRKRAEEELRRERDFSTTLVESSPTFFVAVNSGGKMIMMNQSMLTELGYTTDEVIGTDYAATFVPEEDHEELTKVFESLMVDQEPTTHRNRVLTKDGREVLVEWHVRPMLTPEGDFDYLFAVGIDITHREQVQAALRRNREMLANILSASPMGIGYVEEGRLRWTNQAMLDMLGYRHENECLGKRPVEFYASRDEYKRVQHTLFKSLSEAKPAETEARFRKTDGSFFWGLLRISALDPTIPRRGTIATLSDISARKEAEEALRRAHDELEQRVRERTAELVAANQALERQMAERKRAEDEVRRLNKELERRVIERTAQLEATNKELEAFAYSVSHDLRGPLRSIDGFSQILLEDYKDAVDSYGQDCLRRVQAASQRMGRLIDDLLKLSRLTRCELFHEEVNISAMVQAISQELHSSKPERHVEFLICPNLVVSADEHLLRVALENLLENAWKFTSTCEHARIEFGVTVEAGSADSEHVERPVYFVRDNGAGFDMRYADKLFGAFQRLHSVHEFPGTGIGLATVKRIILRHGGRIWAEGIVGSGATFYFTL